MARGMLLRARVLLWTRSDPGTSAVRKS